MYLPLGDQVLQRIYHSFDPNGSTYSLLGNLTQFFGGKGQISPFFEEIENWNAKVYAV